MKINVMCRKFECRKDIHYKTQTGTCCEKCNSEAFRLGIELASSGLLDQLLGSELHFRQLVRFGSYNVYLYDTRISFVIMSVSLCFVLVSRKRMLLRNVLENVLFRIFQ